MTITPGTKLGRYEIRAPLGAGGMGEVYLAEDTQLGRRVAIKFLPLETIANENSRKRLVREARAAATLDHPNICSIYEVGEVDDRSFIVMQYIEGETLDIRMRRKPLGLSESLAIATQVADALTEAHAHGVIHRDIKPSNIIITSRGQAKVMDFGLAKISGFEVAQSEAPTEAFLTTPGTVIGTVPYMSPEQVKGENVDARSDIFSFGVMLYEMVCGRQPFASESAAATASAILTHEPPPLARYCADVPDELQRIIRKCLEKDRERRCQTMRDVALDLENLRRGLEARQTIGSHDVLAEASESALARALSWRWRVSHVSKSVLVAAALVATLVAAAVIYALYLRRARTTSVPEIKSLAVLPLNNLSGDPSQDYFADGMTEALITELAKIGALRVISRTSVMQYKEARRSLPQIARELNVDAVVEGSVQRSGDRVRITAQLIEAATDRHLWVQSYERDLRDILALQSDVAGAIAEEIKIKLTPQQQAHRASERPVNPEAYDSYLKGLFFSNHPNKADNDAAIEMLERAIQIDPNFAIAYAALARAYIVRFTYLAPQEGPWEEKALAAVEKALSLDPDLAEAHLARGFLLWTPSYHFPHERAVQEYQRAIVLNPSLDEAHHQLALVYLHIGLLDKALQELQTAVAINPSNDLAQYRIGVAFLYQGRNEEALAVFHKFPNATNPSFRDYHAAWALLNLGRKDEAAAMIEESLRKNPDDTGGVVHSVRAMLFAAAGDERQAGGNIKDAEEKGKGFIHFHHTAYDIACAYALMNKPESAIEWLQKAAEAGLPCYPLFERDHSLDHLRQDPRFITFMTKQKEQWEYYKATL